MDSVANQDSLHNVNISTEKVLLTPKQLKTEFPLPDHLRKQIEKSRQEIAAIIHKKDPRKLIIIGPCSIHDISAALEYGQKLKKLADQVSDQLYIVMRVYFEKPRTTVGWKGLINDPQIDGTFNVEAGLRIARKLCLDLTELGLPLATEALDPMTPQYLADLFSWSAIGARTTESQTHRELASGLSMAVGFKNGTDGGLAVAINAMQSAAQPHRFIGINQNGQVNLLNTKGNPDGHVILRGGKKPNFEQKYVMECETALRKAGLEEAIMIDCSHGNSNKDHTRQPIVAENVLTQLLAGNRSIIGLMIESHLNAGNQPSEQSFQEMKYGISITDACIDWQTTEHILLNFAAKLRNPPSSFQ
ncbi:phospho-2-dehydro-3-deoxyheptonate aldolase [[Haemophilus] ducreyi]|uniref:Phospho-2-dehydro-3-deoxyheptonate aldolase n=2 Tax=Haemophilus ducreyi TaxID=730 RepID=Q7VNP6_HAEDU|nr:3-deoxy-7-phosphoheptulonate synthase [[Haemophilus] ducreyi]AAP95406.1 3-deoxy-D-arabinoheptulosonate-7-phosphate synthase [[Haemophilus] ducreyi 35000HP]AKO30517.1 phospho-2-dehydro-3-deoxyheptonate aldolase [[Haemophilus] ducreyi]AKO31953.1 phospho-2-dehydro-3-deoxyheptonate aldolase [[Haemophilus] ducreyi]AKO33407.1 phospho-2-dehydro-3-deoxyheptonate aldolase [[Haemophilus] ducreyi]AKO34854.1 phospho-2-dehydro-3-deoxyheptonate aldolase [[Haemophilus] ducreyi]